MSGRSPTPWTHELVDGASGSYLRGSCHMRRQRARGHNERARNAGGVGFCSVRCSCVCVSLLFLFYYSSSDDGERGTRCARGALAVAQPCQTLRRLKWRVGHGRHFKSHVFNIAIKGCSNNMEGADVRRVFAVRFFAPRRYRLSSGFLRDLSKCDRGRVLPVGISSKS